MVTLQFTFLVLELRKRFQSVNARLRELIPPLCVPEVRAVFGKAVGEVSSQAVPGRLRQLREAYVVLVHAADTLQRHFGLPMALGIGHCIAGATFSAYGLLSPAVLRQSAIQEASLSALWLVHHSSQLVAMTLACAVAVDEATETGVLLVRASAVCGWRCPEVDAFLQLTLWGPRVRFTAAGLVVVDRSLLVSSLALVVTYLVVLGQH
ncbi:uncharacterized protein LOC126235637 [Schistocerca nitens]|uniref:uncharacterized protein LOC126235637 n=1 Tax=Schistocerca nitens TaxID=7011 RepID=UPI0021186238|nr:uncharacterized protein LOC126235637 [Schistocerca nitens]